MPRPRKRKTQKRKKGLPKEFPPRGVRTPSVRIARHLGALYEITRMGVEISREDQAILRRIQERNADGIWTEEDVKTAAKLRAKYIKEKKR